jgi:hypothetical protein
MNPIITAVPVAAAADPPALSPPTELPLADFVTILQNSPMSGMPQLANPAALASELVGNLRGFVERASYYEKLKFFKPGLPADGGRAKLAAADGGRLPELRGGTTRDDSALADLGPADEGEAPESQSAESAVADLERLMEFCLKALNFSTEATLMGSGMSQVVRSVDSLLRAQ